MKIKLYQIAPGKDDKNLMFMSYEFTVLHGGINADSYELVFDGDLPAQTAEDVFRIFQPGTSERIQRPLYERFGYRLDGRYRLLVLRQHWLQANQICRRKMLLEEV